MEENDTYPLVLIAIAILASGSTKKFPAALAFLLSSMSFWASAWCSLKYFSALARMVFLLATLSFLA